MVPFIDLHTHHLSTNREVIAIYNQLLPLKDLNPGTPFSAGLHPWQADQLSINELSEILDQLGENHLLRAFGETGLDKLGKVPINLQTTIFKLHIDKALKFEKPLIIHCVKSWNEIIPLTKGFPYAKIIHGYQGGVELTQRLLKEGFSFSVGESVTTTALKHANSIHLIPLPKLFYETDESHIFIANIYESLAGILSMKLDDLKEEIFNNYCRLIR